MNVIQYADCDEHLSLINFFTSPIDVKGADARLLEPEKILLPMALTSRLSVTEDAVGTFVRVQKGTFGSSAASIALKDADSDCPGLTREFKYDPTEFARSLEALFALDSGNYPALLR